MPGEWGVWPLICEAPNNRWEAAEPPDATGASDNGKSSVQERSLLDRTVASQRVRPVMLSVQQEGLGCFKEQGKEAYDFTPLSTEANKEAILAKLDGGEDVWGDYTINFKTKWPLFNQAITDEADVETSTAPGKPKAVRSLERRRQWLICN